MLHHESKWYISLLQADLFPLVIRKLQDFGRQHAALGIQLNYICLSVRKFGIHLIIACLILCPDLCVDVSLDILRIICYPQRIL